MQLIKATLFLLSIGITGCATTGTGVSREASRFIELVECVTTISNPAVAEGTAISTAVNQGMQACDKSISRYVNALIDKTMWQHGWSSVQPSVRPEVRAQVIETTTAAIIEKYEEIE